MNGGGGFILEKLKNIAVMLLQKLLRFLVILAIFLEVFVSGPKVEMTVTRGEILREMPEADFTPEDYELIDQLIVAVNNTEPRDLQLHGIAAYRNGERFFKEKADVVVRHIVYDRDEGCIDITYETGKNREVMLRVDGSEYRKVIMVYDSLPGRWLGCLPGQLYAGTWGRYTCYSCRVNTRTGEVRSTLKADYRHDWFAWFAKVRDWSRNTMLEQK